jgi:hypothetical protein
MDGALISIRVVLRSRKVCCQQRARTRIAEGVAEEMLLCEVMVQFSICRKHYAKKSAYEGAVQQDREKLFLSAAAADRLFIQAFMFQVYQQP